MPRSQVNEAQGDIRVADDTPANLLLLSRLLKNVRANLGRFARDIQDTPLTEVHEFAGDTVQFDDIALMTVLREP